MWENEKASSVGIGYATHPLWKMPFYEYQVGSGRIVAVTHDIRSIKVARVNC